MSKIGAQCRNSDLLNNSTISGAIEHMTILSWSLEPALPARLVPTKICSFPTEIFTPQPRHPFYSSLWSLQHFWCITLPSPQTMAILCLRDSLYPSSQALSGTSHPILLHQFHLFSVSAFFFSACHQECSLVVSDLLSGLKGLIWSSLCLLSMLPMVPSSQTPARSIFPSRSSRFPKCDSSSIHILLVSLQMISMNVTVLISPL
jgi:hypothetical protein